MGSDGLRKGAAVIRSGQGCIVVLLTRHASAMTYPLPSYLPFPYSPGLRHRRSERWQDCKTAWMLNGCMHDAPVETAVHFWKSVVDKGLLLSALHRYRGSGTDPASCSPSSRALTCLPIPLSQLLLPPHTQNAALIHCSDLPATNFEPSATLQGTRPVTLLHLRRGQSFHHETTY